MIVDCYDPINLFKLVPKLKLRFEPELVQLDELLDDDELFKLVKADLVKRYPNSGRLGRHSTPAEVILRMLVVKRLYGWSYQQTERFVSDSIVLRQFCRLYLESAPDDTTLIRWANTIGPETIAALNDRVVELARSLKVTRGRKLRVDSTVVETNIHYPTDSRLLADGVRVVSRLLRRAREALGEEATHLGKEAFRTRNRSARRLTKKLHRISTAQGRTSQRRTQGGIRKAREGHPLEPDAGKARRKSTAREGGRTKPPSGGQAGSLRAARRAGHRSGGAPRPPRGAGPGRGEGFEPL
jgi:transposase, IS5 family